MQNDIDHINKNQNKGKIVVGFFLLVGGALLLLERLTGFSFTGWLFDWPTILIIVGLYTGFKHNFQKPAAYVLIVIGFIFMFDHLLPGINFSHLLWPLIIITIGTMMILGRNQKWDASRFKRRRRSVDAFDENQKQYSWDKKVNPDNPNEPLTDTDSTDYKQAEYLKADPLNQNYSERKADQNYSSEDYLDATSIFGSANKTILSKNFKGGDIINISEVPKLILLNRTLTVALLSM